MNDLAERFAARGVGSFFLYTHEAHPGAHYPHLTSMEQKERHAEALRSVYGVTRPILLDALDGACHRAYGGMPNMTWIFDRRGAPVYKADWTDSTNVAAALGHFLDARDRRMGGEYLTAFKVERLDYRENDKEGFMTGLERNGPPAPEEYEIFKSG